MRKGFTIIELLVASALLGLLVTILTMIFNQSSIAWRVGVAGVSDLTDIRTTLGSVQDIADNAFVYGSKGYRILGLWDSQGDLRNRACDADDLTDSNSSNIRQMTQKFFQLQNALSQSDTIDPEDFKPKRVGSGDSGGQFTSYTVNVMSGGPANDYNDWQAIWSFPDDPSEW